MLTKFLATKFLARFFSKVLPRLPLRQWVRQSWIMVATHWGMTLGLTIQILIGWGTLSWARETSQPIEREGPPHFEFWTGSLASVGFVSNFGTAITSIQIFGPSILSNGLGGLGSFSGGYFISHQIEILVSPAFTTVSQAGSSESLIQVLGGFNYSFSREVENSIYLTAEAGFSTTSPSAAGASAGTGADTYFTAYGALGKRFSIVKHLNYAPQISYEIITTSPSNTTAFALEPIQFTFIF